MFGLSVTTSKGTIVLGEKKVKCGVQTICDDPKGEEENIAVPPPVPPPLPSAKVFCLSRVLTQDLISGWPATGDVSQTDWKQTNSDLTFSRPVATTVVSNTCGFALDETTGVITIPYTGLYLVSYVAQVERTNADGDAPLSFYMVPHTDPIGSTGTLSPLSWVADPDDNIQQATLMRSTDFNSSSPWAVQLNAGATIGTSVTIDGAVMPTEGQAQIVKSSSLSIVWVGADITPDITILLRTTRPKSLYSVLPAPVSPDDATPTEYLYIPVDVAPWDAVVRQSGGLSLANVSGSDIFVPIQGYYKISIRQLVTRNTAGPQGNWNFELWQGDGSGNPLVEPQKWSAPTWNSIIPSQSAIAVQDLTFVLSSELVVPLEAGSVLRIRVKLSGTDFGPSVRHSDPTPDYARLTPQIEGSSSFADSVFIKYVGALH